MKYQLQSIQKFKAILTVLQRYRNCFENIPAFEESFQKLTTNTVQMSQLITKLTVPVKSVNHQRVYAYRQLLNEFAHLLQISFVFVNETDKLTLHSFVKDYRSVSTHQLLQYANYLLKIISLHTQAAARVGITDQETQQLYRAIEQYENAKNEVAHNFDQRKSNRQQIQNLIAKNHEILENSFDRYLKANQFVHSDFCHDYKFVRFKQNHQSKKTEIPKTTNFKSDTSTYTPETKATAKTVHPPQQTHQIKPPMPQLILNIMLLSVSQHRPSSLRLVGCDPGIKSTQALICNQSGCDYLSTNNSCALILSKPLNSSTPEPINKQQFFQL